MKFYIIGAGVGSADFLTKQARDILDSCDLVISTERIINAIEHSNILITSYSEMAGKAIESGVSNIALLVTGDSGFFSAAKSLIPKLQNDGQVEVICGISSLQYFCAKIQKNYDNSEILSVHGRKNQLMGAVSYNRKVFALTGGQYNVQNICEDLTERGLGFVNVYVGENLSTEKERLLTGTAEEISKISFDDLAVMLIENEHAVNGSIALSDSDFIRGDVPMTKEEIRWISVNKLKIESTDIIYDIGAGTGSVSMDMAKKADKGMVYAIEHNEKAIDLIYQNREKTGCYNVDIIHEKAPLALLDLPAPDCAFIGGSSGNMKEIVSLLREKNPNVRIVINVIALESLTEAIEALADFEDTEIINVNVSRAKKLGRYNMMMANNPVYILSGGKYE